VERADRGLDILEATLFITSQSSWDGAYVAPPRSGAPALPQQLRQASTPARRSAGDDSSAGDGSPPPQSPSPAEAAEPSPPPRPSTPWTGALLGFEKTVVRFGRPNFDAILGNAKRTHGEEASIGVFACGPKALTRALGAAVRRQNALGLGPPLHALEEHF
jgi:hypothetical protein